MIRRLLVPPALAALVLLAGCGPIKVPTFPTSTPTPPRPTSASVTVAPTTTAAPTSTVSPTPPPATSRPQSTTTTRPPVTTTAAPPPPVAVGDTAAARFGWGAPVAGDEFTYAGRPDPSKWGVYDSPGHAGKGRRTPTAFSVDGATLTVRGDAAGNTGGMAYRDGQYRGGWETRMRVPRGSAQYHPVLILWPDAEDFPVGGEVDYAETSTAATSVDFFLHYGASNSQTHGERAVDLTQWHNYAVRWDAACITGYVDAVPYFTDCTPSHLPPRAMHQTIQLDWFPGSGPPQPSSMEVDWVHQYAP